MRSAVLATCVLCAGVHGTLYGINEEFAHLKSDLPMRTIEDVVHKQNEMIDVLAAFVDVTERLPLETLDPHMKPKLMPPTMTHRGGGKDTEYLDVHNDVVFVGFPASAVEAMRAKWFDQLTHTDPLLATLGANANVVVAPGGMLVRHHFHLVQISFHVADRLRDYVSQLLLHPTGDGVGDGEKDGNTLGDHYINAWELEELLESLADTIGSTHTMRAADGGSGPEQKSAGAAGTLFVVNLDVGTTRGAEVRYSYRHGFTTGDLRTMAVDAEVLKAAENVLSGRRSTRADLVAEDKQPLFPTPAGSSSGSSGSGGSSSTARTYARTNEAMNTQVHWRDAVSATRDWAKGLGETITGLSKDGRFTLKERALRILKAAAGSPLARHTRSLATAVVAAARRPLSDAEAAEAERTCSHCSATTWVGSGRVMWRDLHAVPAAPVHRSMGNSPSEPQPRPLSETDWLKVGTIVVPPKLDKKKKLESVEEIEETLYAMQRQLTSLEHMIWQAGCPDFNTPIINMSPAPPKGGQKRADAHLDALGELLEDRVSSRTITPTCAHLAMQVALLETLRIASQEMGAMSTRWLGSPQADEVKWYLGDFAHLHARLLLEALEISNPLLASAVFTPIPTAAKKKSKDAGPPPEHDRDRTVPSEGTQVHAGKLSEEAAVYLGHLTSYVQRAARYRVAPPMALRLDPAVDPASALAAPAPLTPITAALRSRVEMYQRRLTRDRIRYGERVHGDYEDGVRAENEISRFAHAYTGESMLELILSESMYGGHGGPGGGTEARREHEADEVERSLPLWASLLPSVLFPTKVDVVLYVVKLQSTYEPLARGAEEGGFDFATFIAEVGRLKLPNQHMAVSVQVLDRAALAGERGISLGLASCRREARVPAAPAAQPGDTGAPTEYYRFLDGACVWAHLHPVDEQAANALARQDKDRKAAAQTLHLPVFLISTAEDDPVFLADLQQASVVGDMVLVVQNQQEKILSELTCVSSDAVAAQDATYAERREVSGRNPLAAALAAVARAVGGLPGGQWGHRGLPTAPNAAAALGFEGPADAPPPDEITGSDSHALMNGGGSDAEYAGWGLQDWSTFLGPSPVFEATALSSHYLPSFSALEIELMHRARVLRSVGLSRAAAQIIADGTVGALTYVLDDGLERLQKTLTEAMAAADVADWAAAAGAANAGYLLAQELLAHHHAHVRDLTVTAATTPADRHNNTYLAQQAAANAVRAHDGYAAYDAGNEDTFVWFCVKCSVWIVPVTVGTYYAVAWLVGGGNKPPRPASHY